MRDHELHCGLDTTNTYGGRVAHVLDIVKIVERFGWGW
jgi:hypothetical protein